MRGGFLAPQGRNKLGGGVPEFDAAQDLAAVSNAEVDGTIPLHCPQDRGRSIICNDRALKLKYRMNT